MRSSRKFLKSFRSSHHAASVHAPPEHAEGAHGPFRSVSLFVCVGEAQLVTGDERLAHEHRIASPIVGTYNRVSASNGSRSLGTTLATLSRIESLARASKGSPLSDDPCAEDQRLNFVAIEHDRGKS